MKLTHIICILAAVGEDVLAVNEFYAVRTGDFATSYCDNATVPVSGINTYPTELECCQGEFSTQVSNFCLQQLPNPPTSAPTTVVWYPDLNPQYSLGKCINTLPVPKFRPTFTDQLECCTTAYTGQTSGTCIKNLENPPTSAPTPVVTASPTVTPMWYAVFGSTYDDGTCSNATPPPAWLTSGSLYATQTACCNANFNNQNSGTCLVGAPTVSPTPEGTAAPTVTPLWYAVFGSTYDEGTCSNATPPPAWLTSDSLYATQFGCCEANFSNQGSGTCLVGASVPTGSPTTTSVGATSTFIFYPVWSGSFDEGYCDNDPSGKKSYFVEGSTLFETQVECCAAFFPQQSSKTCLTRVPADGTLGPTPTPVVYYYPKWGATNADGRCLNDGNQGSWFTAPDYLFESGYDCCEKWFKKQDGTFGISNCLLALGYTNTPTNAPTHKPTTPPTQ